MFEIIIDVTRKCFMQCKYCGTDSVREDNTFLPADIIEPIVKFANDNGYKVYLGGGCFFSHPDYERMLRFFRSILSKNIIIDVPMHIDVLTLIEKYPMSQFHYDISVSLWGIEHTHNTLSNSNGWHLMNTYHKKMELHQGYCAYSFVISKELIEEKSKVVSFINNLGVNDKVYFHRMMPTGRCRFEDIPSPSSVLAFSEEVQSHCKIPLRFHHTICRQGCKAYKERLFIDSDGSIYGCGWVGKNTPIDNIKKTSIDVVMKSKEWYKEYICPLQAAP